jgi:hypothetical protein
MRSKHLDITSAPKPQLHALDYSSHLDDDDEGGGDGDRGGDGEDGYSFDECPDDSH